MTDKKKQPESRRTEDLSPAELRAQIEEDKKKVSRSTVFLFAALIAIIVICIAWFVANTRVNVTTGAISAQDSTLFELASVGNRTEAESEHLVDANKKNLLTAGNTKDYETYYDMQAESEVSKKQTYHVGTADLAWYLGSDKEKLSPGATGKLEFYIIPKVDGLTEITVDLKATAYTETAGNIATKSEDPIVQNLLEGHVLFFKNLNSTSGYSGWINGKLIIKASTKQSSGDETATFKKDVPHKVAIYWVWPEYFRNYIYDSKTTYGDLFTDISTNNADYGKLLTFVSGQAGKSWKENKMFYSADTDNKESNPGITDTINSSIPENVLNTCSDYYNQADEYIGRNAKYIYINAEATAQ